MKKLLTLALSLTLCLSLDACGGSKETPAAEEKPVETETPAETTVLNVAASATPHAEILEVCVPILAEQGIDLQVHVYGDYVVPNTAVEEGAEDANYFQHVPYLDNFNAENGTHLVSVAGVHIEPMGIYAGKTASLDELADGASVAVPNDVTNEARALLLLEAQGLIKLSDDAGLDATPNDIVENPKNLTFTELEAAMVPNALTEVDIAVINVNYALEAGFNPVEDALAIEDADSPYVNILVVKEGNENNPAVQALEDELDSDDEQDIILVENSSGRLLSSACRKGFFDKLLFFFQSQLYFDGQHRASAQQQGQCPSAPEQAVTHQLLVLLPAHGSSKECQHSDHAEYDADDVRRQFPAQGPCSQIQQEPDSGKDSPSVDLPGGQRSLFRVFHINSP